MHNWRIPAIALLAAAIAGCMVGPDHVRPLVETPERFAGAAAAQGKTGAPIGAANPADSEFWGRFNDPLLTRLIELALVTNHDLRIALANVDRANALIGARKFDGLPVITAGGVASDDRASSDQLPGVSRNERDRSNYSVGFKASWELDFFGGIRRGIEAESAGAAASASDLAVAQVAVVGALARSYAEVRGLQERLRVARENADNQRETLHLVEVRFSVGSGNEFDTSRARAQLESTLSRIPALESALAVQMHRVAVLAGKTPEALVSELQVDRPLPILPARIDPGTPGDLLRRRPDVAAAEQRLHAATARIGVATADLFPRFTLGGLIGSQSVDTNALFERDGETRLIAMGIDWSFLDLGHVRSRIAASTANASGELARYEQTVLGALEDTENALARHAHARVEDAHLQNAAASSNTAARLARTRFDAGATGLFDVLDTERTRLLAQEALAIARTKSVTSAVDLYVALAGGWPLRLPNRKEIASN